MDSKPTYNELNAEFILLRAQLELVTNPKLRIPVLEKMTKISELMISLRKSRRKSTE